MNYDENGDYKTDAVDMNKFYATLNDIPPEDRALYDFNNDGTLNINDVQKIYNENQNLSVGEYAPTLYSQYGYDFGQIMSMAIHEVGHNLGLQHDMGETECVEIGGTEYLAISPMLSIYYFRDEGPSPGDTNHLGDTIESDNLTFAVWGFQFGDGIRENIGQVLYDE